MTTRQRRRSFLSRLWLPAVAIAFLGYFSFHAFHGYYGIWAKEKLEAEASQLEAELAGLTAEREALQRRVNMLRPETLTPDMIDEQARESLNVLHPDELVIYGALQRNDDNVNLVDRKP